MKKIIAFVLVFSLLFGMTATYGSATEVDSSVIKTADSEEAIENLNMDFPVIEIPGFGERIFGGLDTETEEDDYAIFPPAPETARSAVLEHAGGLLAGILFKNFDRLDKHLGGLVIKMLGGLGCNPDGTVKEGTGGKYNRNVEPKDEYGYEHRYPFLFDWRKDMHTLATELHEYIENVKEVTGSDKVGVVAFSQGNCILMTYLYEYYYTETDVEKRDEIAAAVFMCGAMNGVGSCEDPLSGNIEFDSISLLRFVKHVLGDGFWQKAVYFLVEILYAVGALDSIVKTANEYVDSRMASLADPYLLSTFGGLPGFFAMMSPERYKEAEEFLFNTPEIKEKYEGMIGMNHYFHEEVQINYENIIDMLLSEGKKVAIMAEYGYPIAPATSNNDRMTDASICTAQESFGATCSDVDGILGLDYIQAKECECGGNHVSADLQIDASTCAYPDITWFAKYLWHDGAIRFWGDILNLVIYSEKQVTVWDFSDYPQFLINHENSCLVPLTNEEAVYAVAFEESLFFKGRPSKDKA